MLAIVTPDPDSVAETFIRQHIDRIAPGHTVVAYLSGDGRKVAHVCSLKIPLGRCLTLGAKFTHFANVLSSRYKGCLRPAEERSLIEFLRSHGVRAVLAEFGQTGCAVARACEKASVPLFVYFHGQDASSYGKKWSHRLAYRCLAKSVRRVFVGTHYFIDRVEEAGIPRRLVEVVPYGVETEQFKSAKGKDPLLVLACGRMVEKKAPQLTVRAFSLALRAVPNARLELIGDGPLLQDAITTAKNLGVDGQIRFYGARSHAFVKTRMAEASVFLQHSVTAKNGDTESLGVSLLEAMASETPVVATRHNGFVETVPDAKTGYLVDEYDFNSMALRLVDLLMNPDLRKRMGKAGRAHVIQNYSSDAVARVLRSQIFGHGAEPSTPSNRSDARPPSN